MVKSTSNVTFCHVLSRYDVGRSTSRVEAEKGNSFQYLMEVERCSQCGGLLLYKRGNITVAVWGVFLFVYQYSTFFKRVLRDAVAEMLGDYEIVLLPRRLQLLVAHAIDDPDSPRGSSI